MVTSNIYLLGINNLHNGIILNSLVYLAILLLITTIVKQSYEIKCLEAMRDIVNDQHVKIYNQLFSHINTCYKVIDQSDGYNIQESLKAKFSSEYDQLHALMRDAAEANKNNESP